MKPNFALDLTFDGITLLHRTGEAGWHVVGEVALAAPSLADDLAALRQKANALGPSGVHTKLIIPDEQIRYLDIPAEAAPDGDHGAAAAEALDGATPYALDDLVYDWAVQGTRLYIAAVARETLDEAESFAREHQFNPVCFVADPDQELYPGVPFFGMTSEAESLGTIERDDGPITRLGARPEADAKQEESDTSAPDPAAVSFASVRAERGLPPRAATLLEGVSRITPGPLADADARALSGAAQASLVPRVEAPSPMPEAASTSPKRKGKSQDPAPKISSLSHVKAGKTQSTPAAANTAEADAGGSLLPHSDEAERLTIFGARSENRDRRGKPRFLGLILTVVLLIVLIGVAAWAAIFPDTGLGRLLRGEEPQIAVTPDIPELQSTEPQLPEEPVTSPSIDSEPAPIDPTQAPAEPEVAALPEPAEPATVPDETDIVEDTEPETASSRWTEPETADEARRRYAATGIWPSAPEAPKEPETASLETFYQTSIDTDVRIGDAVALPQAQSLTPDRAPRRPALPPPPDRTFELDQRGFVRATPEGALTPEGVRVYSGPPPTRPPDTPARAVPLPGLTPTEEALEARENLSGIRPRQRPTTLVEEHERGALGGRTRNELATLRPRTRPATVTEQAEAMAQARAEAEAVAAAVAKATDEAVAESLKPRLRPAAVARNAATTSQPRPAETSSTPNIPSSASVARSATERNAINLRKVNLIGVYGSPSNRRALVRLSNGQYRKVQVGDRIDGGRVSAIGDSELRYTKSGRSVVLRIPRG